MSGRAPSPIADPRPTRRRRGPQREARSIRVLLVDDHRALAEALSRLLGSEPGISMVGVAYSAAEARSRLREPVDVVLMDYALPDGTGAEVTRAVKARWPKAPVIMLDRARRRRDGPRLDPGRRGRLPLEDRLDRRGPRGGPGRVRRGDAPATGRDRQDRAPGATGEGDRERGPQIEPLTVRELEILRALSAGRTTREICDELSIAPNTLRTHVQNITAKLHVHSKLEAVVFALRYGLVDPPTADERLYP